MCDRYLDCRGRPCPRPLVEISRAVREMASGETLLVEAADRAFGAAVKAWVKKTGHTLVEFVDGDVQRVVIRKA